MTIIMPPQSTNKYHAQNGIEGEVPQIDCLTERKKQREAPSDSEVVSKLLL